MINPDFDSSDNPLSQGGGNILRSELERWAEATTKLQGAHEARFLEKVEAVTEFFSVVSRPPQEIRPPDVRIWCDALEAGGFTATTIRDHIVSLSSFFEWLLKASIPELPVYQNPTKVVRRQPLEAASADNWGARTEALIKRACSVRFGSTLNLRDFSTDDMDELEELLRYQRSQLGTFTDPTDVAACEDLIFSLKEFSSRLKKLRIMYLICAMRAVSEVNRKRGELVNWDMIIDDLRRARPSWNIPSGEDLTVQCLDKLDALLIDSLNQRLSHMPRTRLASAPIARDGFLRFPSERIFKATVEALMPGALLTGSSLRNALERYSGQAEQISDRFRAAYVFKSGQGDLEGTIGFPYGADDTSLKVIRDMPSLAVKAVFALWARLYAELGAPAYGQYICISVSQFCDDLGYKRKNNSHEPENRRQAIQMLKAILELEALITYRPTGCGTQMQGSIFQRYPLAPDVRGYTDIHASSRLAEHENLRGATAFAYGPGKVYENPLWQLRNRAVALAGAGFLTLGNGNNDKWAVLIGGYLATFARMNRYRQHTLDAQTLLEKTGLFGEKAKHRQLTRMDDKLGNALERLKRTGFIKRVNPIFDDSGNLLTRRVEICWPDALSERAPGELKRKKRRGLRGKNTEKRINR